MRALTPRFGPAQLFSLCIIGDLAQAVDGFGFQVNGFETFFHSYADQIWSDDIALTGCCIDELQAQDAAQNLCIPLNLSDVCGHTDIEFLALNCLDRSRPDRTISLAHSIVNST